MQRGVRILIVTAALAALIALSAAMGGEGETRRATMTKEKTATAVFGGGCFWCVEAVFEELRGVNSVVSGYAGGHVKDPTYRQVCTGKTGHAEVVRITYDPDEISYKQLLEVFFTTHDPTTLNRQGADVGTQYRSIILYTDKEQKAAAEAVIKELAAEKVFEKAIVTELAPLKVFYPAEEHHQEFYARNSNKPYCQIVINPKLRKLRAKHAELLRRKE
jgi:peptide-methionine (S)-S-oxide reductase